MKKKKKKTIDNTHNVINFLYRFVHIYRIIDRTCISLSYQQ
ncbi:hypothetical protein AKUG0420_PLPX00350 (plasmid) [Apilactobacillus kunkeei]|nr:hypothetical protein AKUG0420_PLPX00350 [Apilactobacillus kunkeei]